VTATWKERWLIVAFPHGRAFLLENGYGRIALALSFECPLNASAVAFAADAVEDSALVIFGTDEGPLASYIHVVRMTFASDTISVKVIDTFASLGGVSSLVPVDESRILISYSVRKGVDVFNPSTRRLNEGSGSPSIRSEKTAQGETSFDYMSRPHGTQIEEAIIDADLPLDAFVIHGEIYTLTRNGTLSLHIKDNTYSLKGRISLGFDSLGMLPLAGPLGGVLVCGLRGELAVIDSQLKCAARFQRRSRVLPQIDGCAISISQDSRILVLQTTADEPERVDLIDLAALCLGGTAPVLDAQMRRREDDDTTYEFVRGTKTSADKASGEPALKNSLKEAWNLLCETQRTNLRPPQ
jgi:hypothetical protein